MSRTFNNSASNFGAFHSSVGYDSNEEYKRMANRKLRRKSKESILDAMRQEDDEDMDMDVRRYEKPMEVSDIYDFPSDGKHKFERFHPELKNIDPSYIRKSKIKFGNDKHYRPSDDFINFLNGGE